MNKIEEIISIYRELKEKFKNNYDLLKNELINSNELQPIKKELILITKYIKFDNLDLFVDLIKVLFILKQENKLDIINRELIDYLNQIKNPDDVISVIFALTYSNERLTDNILDNRESMTLLKQSFYATYKTLEKNFNNFNYLNKTNNVYANISTHYLHIKDKLNIKDYDVNEMYILSNVLDLVSSIMYVNIQEYNYDYDLMDRFMNDIENNLLKYFIHFKNERLWCIGNPVMPESIGGFTKEFIVIGDLVNKFFLEEEKTKK